jgi:hypothetical protein
VMCDERGETTHTVPNITSLKTGNKVKVSPNYRNIIGLHSNMLFWWMGINRQSLSPVTFGQFEVTRKQSA